MTIAAGTRLGRYEIRSKLGEGGMGEVYLAEDTQLGRRVAIKFLSPDAVLDEHARKRLVREARAAATLDHPNICAVYEVGEADGRSFIAMQYLEGETLDLKLKRKPLELKESLALASQIADALAEAHAHGIIHRDIKPGNIMITSRGQAKVMDFGLAKVVVTVESEAETQSLLTTPGAVVGTVPYMSPEQLKGAQVDARSDIFSFGVVLYEMVTGRQAFVRQTPAETIAAILKDEPRELAEAGVDIPSPGLEQLIRHCLAKNPDERFQSARDLALTLRAMSTSGTRSTSIPARPTRRIHPFVWVGAALLVAAVAGIAWWQYWRRTPVGQLQQRLISSFPGSHREASFSSDGSLITFINDAGGVPQVWVKNLAQGDPIQITTGDAAAHRPRWSPNNDQIVFSRAGSIWSVPPLGGTPRKTIEGGYNPNWSWDGSRLVYEKDEGIWTAGADGSDQRKVEGVPRPDRLLADRTPAFSPDSSQLAFFQCSKGPFGDIWVIPSAGGEPRQLTFDDHFGGTPVWTPDGRFIIFSSLRAGSRTLWKIAASGGAPQPVLQGAGEDTDPELSRDGSKLIYTNTRNSFILTLWNPATNMKRELMEARYDITDPSFSPQADRISFFLVENDGDFQLHTIDPDGGNSVEVTRTKGERNIHPRWSPDGSWLYFYQVRPTFSFRKISVSGGQSFEIAADWAWGTHSAAEVDPQDKLIAYVRQEKDRPPVTTIRVIETGKETVFKSSFMERQWSRDGKAILGMEVPSDSTAVREISICSVETGACRQLTQGRVPRWSSDGSRVYFLRDSKSGGGQELWSMSSQGGDEKQIGVLRFHPIGTFYDVSPKGEIVYVQYNPGKPELWLADFPRP
jgi:serine/threonine protein kinase/dipeptidyl aminopeptidase/acylaminoacyl peptidase